MKKFFALAIVATMAMPLFAADGAAVYKAKCAMCHGADGAKPAPKGINGPDTQAKGAAGLNTIITKGSGKMPAYEGKLSPEEISAVTDYVLTLK
jgi:mono/diheme cytochrome c family protein